MKTKIEPADLSDNIIRLIGQDWMLITAGSCEQFNTMTASWGGIGFLWGKAVVYVYVRPERYTFEFIESNEYFSLSFFGKDFKKVLSLLGSKSGRDSDKIAESGLTPFFTEQGTPAFEEARITIECHKIYSTPLSTNGFIDKSLLEKWYTSHGSLHHMYVAEMVNVWIEQ